MRRDSQRGAVTAIFVLIMLALIAFVLVLLLAMSTSEVVDTAQHNDSVDALYLAESGIERAAYRFVVDAAECGDLAPDGPLALGRGSFDIQASFTTAFDGASDLGAGQCRIRSAGVIGNVRRTIEAVIEQQGNLLAESNPDFNDPPPPAPGPPAGWTLSSTGAASGDPWDDNGGPDGSRSAYVNKPSPGPTAATVAGQFALDVFTVSAPVTLTLSFDYRVVRDPAGGPPNEMALRFALSDGTTTYPQVGPDTFESGHTGGYAGGSVSIPVTGTGAVTLTQLTFDLTAKAGRPKQIWLDNLVLEGPGGAGGGQVVLWREVVDE